MAKQPASVPVFDGMDIDSGATVTCTPHLSLRGILPHRLHGKYLEVANGDIAAATHAGTIRLVARDKSGIWRVIEQEGAWLVPNLSMSLLSVRRCKELGWRAPDFDSLTVYDASGRAYPMGDKGRRYVIDAEVPEERVAAARAEVLGGGLIGQDNPGEDLPSAGAGHERGTIAAAIAHGRRPLPISRMSAAEAAQIYHSANGHLAADSLRRLVDRDGGLSRNDKDKIKRGLAKLDCSHCRVASMQTQPVSDTEDIGFVASDVKTSLPEVQVSPFRGARHIVLFKDLGSRHMGLYFVRHKSAGAAYKQFIADVRVIRPGYTPRVLRSDGGGEYTSNAFEAYCSEMGTVKEVGPPYDPNKTLVESDWRTVGRAMRSALSESGLPLVHGPLRAPRVIGVAHGTPHRDSNH